MVPLPDPSKGKWYCPRCHISYTMEPEDAKVLAAREREQIQAQMLAFVGATAFEELCRAWVWQQVTARRFPFLPQDVGAHWGKGIQVDVVAISWQDKAILLGEAEWSTGPVGGAVIRQLIEGKTPKVLAALPHRGEEWAIHFAFFARAGFTEAAQAEAKRHGAMLVDLATLDHDAGRYVKSA